LPARLSFSLLFSVSSCLLLDFATPPRTSLPSAVTSSRRASLFTHVLRLLLAVPLDVTAATLCTNSLVRVPSRSRPWKGRSRLRAIRGRMIELGRRHSAAQPTKVVCRPQCLRSTAGAPPATGNLGRVLGGGGRLSHGLSPSPATKASACCCCYRRRPLLGGGRGTRCSRLHQRPPALSPSTCLSPCRRRRRRSPLAPHTWPTAAVSNVSAPSRAPPSPNRCLRASLPRAFRSRPTNIRDRLRPRHRALPRPPTSILVDIIDLRCTSRPRSRSASCSSRPLVCPRRSRLTFPTNAPPPPPTDASPPALAGLRSMRLGRKRLGRLNPGLKVRLPLPFAYLFSESMS